MKFHIVGNGESIDDILKGYDISIDELKNENKHIRIWNNLIPGTKLKIPVLTETIVEEINEVEPFIEDYYPKIKVEEEEYSIIEDVIEEEKEEIIETNNNILFENEIVEEKEAEKIEKIIEEKVDQSKEENIIRPYSPQTLIRYVYPPQYYYRPIIYVIPRR